MIYKGKTLIYTGKDLHIALVGGFFQLQVVILRLLDHTHNTGKQSLSSQVHHVKFKFGLYDKLDIHTNVYIRIDVCMHESLCVSKYVCMCRYSDILRG